MPVPYSRLTAAAATMAPTDRTGVDRAGTARGSTGGAAGLHLAPRGCGKDDGST